jgi:hypothetical protein
LKDSDRCRGQPNAENHQALQHALTRNQYSAGIPKPAKGSAPLISRKIARASVAEPLAGSHSVSWALRAPRPLCGPQRVQNSRWDPHNGLTAQRLRRPGVIFAEETGDSADSATRQHPPTGAAVPGWSTIEENAVSCWCADWAGGS